MNLPLPHIRPERKRHIEKYTPDTKQRVDRNFNESPIIRLYMNGRINQEQYGAAIRYLETCLLYTSPSPRDATLSRMPSSA